MKELFYWAYNNIEIFKWAYLNVEPFRWACNTYMGLIPQIGYLGNLLMQGGLICMIWLTIRRPLFDKGLGKADRRWSRICGSIINRIDGLMPEYQTTMLAYAKFVQKSMVSGDMVKMIRAIPEEAKLQAELEVSRDVTDPEKVRILSAQFLTLKNQSPI